MKRIAVTLASLFILVACTEDAENLEPTDAGTTLPQKDAGHPPDDAGVTSDDAGFMEPDAGVEPARRLIEYRILGDSPTDNLVLSPSFDLFTSGWFAFSLDGQSLSDIARYYLQGTPTKQPALGSSAPAGTAILGTARSSSGPLSTSVWIGYRENEDARFTAQVALLGTDTLGQQVAFDLLPDESSRTVSGEYVWVRYWGMAPEAPVGFVQLYIQEAGPRRVYVTGPVVVPMLERDFGGTFLEPRRQLRAGERLGLVKFAEQQRDRLGRAPDQGTLD